MKISYIGHATILIELADVRILTDPNYDSALGGVLSRVHPPGLEFERLPPLDAIAITHAHMDHLSYGTLRRFPKNIPILAPRGIARELSRKGYNDARTIGQDETIELHNGMVRIHAARARHRGARFGFDWWRSESSMYLIESATESVFFPGDTGLAEDTHAMTERILWQNGRRLDIALLPIGYAPAWKPGFRRGHLSSMDALRLFEKLRARICIPYHWGVFNHVTANAHDAMNEFQHLVSKHRQQRDIHILQPGESLIVLNTKVLHL